ncbi:hypothetical protein KP509_11G012200 [Ceratopteris richardii]|uniref:Uncharacterized protein n=1 Tax=Ceratopteris richardii TaxID=49495 RepID=A0A8T2TQA3_CERRI|nr:hypothetical protein KP509_11G012200 [Ceratopteris richardii]
MRNDSGTAQTSRAARQNICRCVQSAARFINPDPSAVHNLPTICGARNTFSLSDDCSRIP